MEVTNIPGMLEEAFVANLDVAWNIDAKVDESK
jgi:hypothetical protein